MAPPKYHFPSAQQHDLWNFLTWAMGPWMKSSSQQMDALLSFNLFCDDLISAIHWCYMVHECVIQICAYAKTRQLLRDDWWLLTVSPFSDSPLTLMHLSHLHTACNAFGIVARRKLFLYFAVVVQNEICRYDIISFFFLVDNISAHPWQAYVLRACTCGWSRFLVY